jgi:serine/threonine protein kinase/Leucine-rich repeat (LRR) protein
MEPVQSKVDEELLRKLLLGQLASAEIERLEAELADDSRLAALGETMTGKGDALLEQLCGLKPLENPPADPCAQRLIERLRPFLDQQANVTESVSETTGSAGSSVAPAESIPERLEHFHIIRLLGQGGMGAVYLAEDTRLGRQVAIKTLKPVLATKPDARVRFLREARLAATIEHDYVVPIYYVGEANGIPFLAMPYLKGKSLEEFIKGGRKLTPKQIIGLGLQIAQGLAAAHEKGLIHRDIKPGNLWLEVKSSPLALSSPSLLSEGEGLGVSGGGEGEFRVRILDFGLARSIETDTELTQSGAILGTPAYMAPEQAKGEKVDGRADLYSLGVVLYRLATGELPIKGKDTMSMLMALATQTPRPAHELNPEVPAELSALIMRLLAKDRQQRPDSAKEVVQTLLSILASLTAPAPQTSPATSSSAQTVSVVRSEPKPDANLEVFSGETVAESLRLRPTSRRRISRRWPLVAAGLLFAFVGGGLLLQQIILRITDKEGKTREIELKPGDRIEIVEKPADQSALPKTPPKKEPEIKSIAGDPDRRAAEYVLSIGGKIKVRVGNVPREITDVAGLPKEPFQLVFVNLDGNTQVTDTGLAHFRECKNLTYLNLDRTRVTDAGLAHFQDCKNLMELYLWQTQVTDTGLVYVKDCKALTGLSLNNTQVTDAGLAHFKDCKNLTHLYLGATRVTDAGLAYFKDCKNLMHLALDSTRVTDTGLAHFQDCKKLTFLDLGYTRVTDVGLAHFQNCKNLMALNLDNTPITDAGLAYFKDCKNLTYLFLVRTRVTDAGLAYFKDCKNLMELDLNRTQVTDVGLAHFRDCKNLTHLRLEGTGVTDAGLTHFRDCKNLGELHLAGTRVTDGGLANLALLPSLQNLKLDNTRISLAGYKQLKTAMPRCQITWSEPNRLVAERVLELGGTVEIGVKGQPARPVKAVAELPRELFQVRRVSLAGVNKPLDNLPELLSLLRFEEFDRLEKLDLSGITGLNYDFLAPIAGLQELSLANAGLKDPSLERLPKLPTLQRLVLDGNEIRGATLAVLSAQPALVDLSLSCPSLTDLFAKNLAELKQLKRLKRLSLAGTSLTDEGIKHLEGLTNLEALDLRRTKVTAEGIKRLQQALPKCQIE